MMRLFNRMLIAFVLGGFIGFTLWPLIGAWTVLLCLVVGIFIGSARL